MNKHWQTVALGQVLTHRKQFIEIDDSQEYKRYKVQLHVRGIVLRDAVKGLEIKTKKQQVCQAGEFLVAEIDAKVGGLGIVPKELENAIVSSHYFLFGIDESKIDRRFFEFFIKTPTFRDQVSAQGSTNYAAIRPSQVLSYQIPIPSLTEQHRIVARIEALAGKIEEAKRLRQETINGIERLVASKEMQIWNTVNFKKVMSLNNVTTYLSRGRQSKQGKSDHYLIKTQHVQMGKYVTSDMTLSTEVAEKVKPEAIVKSEDILIACSAAGCLGRVAFYEFTDNKEISTDTHIAIARANPDIVLPKYLYAYLKGEQGQNQLRSREKGNWQREKIGFRFTELNVSDMRKVPVPVPSFEEQKRIVAYLDNLQTKVDAVKQHQDETQQQLNALMPAILDKALKGEL